MSFFTLPLEPSFGAWTSLVLLCLGGGLLAWRQRVPLRRALGPLAEIPARVLWLPVLVGIALLTVLALQQETVEQVTFLVGLFQVGLRFLWGRLAVLGVQPILSWVPYRELAWPPWFPGGWVVVLVALAWLSPAVLVLLLTLLGLRRWRWLQRGTERSWLLSPFAFLAALSFVVPMLSAIEFFWGNVTGALGCAYGVFEHRPRMARLANGTSNAPA